MSEKLRITQICPEVYDLTETGANEVDAYLILGEERALLVDCLMSEVGLAEAVRSLTDLPVDVAITHGHGDHAGKEVQNLRAAGFELYMAGVDAELLVQMFGMPETCWEWFRPLKEGDAFDLGGIKLETVAVPGHTPGSVVFYEPERQWLFSGDTVGSGAFWMQIPGCQPLSRFAEALDRLIARVGTGEALKIYPGHRYQSPVQLTGAYLEDVRWITRGILSGEVTGEPEVTRLGGLEIEIQGRVAAHGRMRAYSYDPKNL